MERHDSQLTMRIICGAMIVALGPIASRPIAAQRINNGLSGLVGSAVPIDFSSEARLGAITPHGGRTGVDGTFEWTLGSLGPSSIRPLLGIDAYHADLRRGLDGVPLRGSLASAGVLAGLRLDVNPDGAITPYAITGVTGNYVWASGSDDATKRDLAGAHVGLAVGGGAALWFGPWPFALTADVRHVFAHSLTRTMYTVGFRIQPRVNQLAKRLEGDLGRVKSSVEDLIRLRLPSLPDVDGVIDATEGVEIALGDALFVKGTAKLSDRGNQELSAIADALRKVSTSQIAVDLRPRVVRVCAAIGLARQRATVLRNKLAEAGVGGGAGLIDVVVADDDGSDAVASGPPAECRTATLTVTLTHVSGRAAVP